MKRSKTNKKPDDGDHAPLFCSVKDQTEEANHLDAQQKLSHLTNYHAWSLSFLGGNCGRRIWDAGAGVGLLAEQLLKKDPEHLLLSEFTSMNLEILKERYGGNPKVAVQYCDLNRTEKSELVHQPIDTVILLDVLEHVPDDQKALSLIHDALEAGGHLLIKVPAHPFLFCGIDKASSHFRRYRKKMLRNKLREAGFAVKQICYMNMSGAMLYFLKGKILKKEASYSRTIKDNRLDWMNKCIPFIAKSERCIHPLFGLSVIAVAQKEPD